ncbi:NAD+ synthase [Candidatus Bathyarchaeota archaeon]|nr:NAD+ synthase [Candidatus Bathyarchaeota archaeon]
MKLKLPKLDYDKVAEEIVDFIKKTVESSGVSGVVVGLSGGVDSSLTVVLCKRALGQDKVLGVLMPTSFTPKQDIEDARYLAKELDIRVEEVNIDEISKSFFTGLKCDERDPKYKIPMANVRARIRMVILYFYANLNNYLVAGTGDKSERLIGYFTKYGDGGVDFMPIAHLYKTQVRELASFLGVPERIAYKPSSPQLYPGHKAIDEIPIDYGQLDLVLYGLFDLNLPPDVVCSEVGVQRRVIDEVLRRVKATEHKRRPPPMIVGSPI